MASEDKRDVADGATPSTSGSAISFRKTPEEIKLDLKDTWTTRILVSTGPVAGITSGMFLGRLFRRNPRLVLDIVQWGFKRYGTVKNLWHGSIIIELDCGSQEKYLKFQEDFKDGKVKDALEEELRKIGCHVELKLTLTDRTSTVAAIETSEGTVDQESGETSFDELVKKAEQMWHQRAGHHLTSCATEVKQEWREEPDNLALFGTSKGSVDQRAEKTSFATEIKKAEQMRHQGADPAKDPDQSASKTDFSSVSGKRLKASGSNEAKQEEENVSAAKKLKLDTTGQPGTSGVSSTSKTRKIKEGVVTDDDIETLGKAISGKWAQLARRLLIKREDIEGIDDRFKTLADKGFHILELWKSNIGKAAKYETLYNALVHNLVQRRDLAEEYCFQ